MKKLSVILFLVILGYIQVGYYFHLSKLKIEAKEAAQNYLLTYIPDSLCYVFSGEKIEKNARWEEPDKEFWLNGQLYDVIRVETKNGKINVFCIIDSDEEEIIEAQSVLASESGPEKGKDARPAKFSTPDFIFIIDYHNGISPTTILRHFSLETHCVSYDLDEPISPPPQV